MRRPGGRRWMLLALLTLVLVLAGSRVGVAANPEAPVTIPAPPLGDGQESSDLLQQVMERQLDQLDTAPLQDVLEGLDPEVRRLLPPLDVRRLLVDAEARRAWDPWRLAQALLSYLGREVLVSSRLLGQLLILAVLCALLRTLAGSLAGQGVQEVAFAVTLLALLLLGLEGFRAALQVGRNAIDGMVSFMLALLPLLSTMLAAVGAISTAALFHPLLVAVTNGVATVTGTFLFPLVFASTVLGMVGNVSEGFPLGRLAGFLRQVALLCLGFGFTLFSAVLAVRGAIAPVADGVALRTAKFLTGAFVPIVGGQLAGAMDVVVGGSMLIKNAVGALGLTGLVVLSAFPIVKMAAILLIFRLANLALSPIAESRLVDAVNGLAGGVALVMACVLTVALMFFVSVTVLVSAGNLAGVLR